MEGKIYEDPEIGAVTLRKNIRSRRMTIRVHPTRGVTLTIPYFVSYKAGLQFFQQKRDWVLEALARQKRDSSGRGVLPQTDINLLRREARAYLPERLRALALRYGFTYNRLSLKNNRSNWGSCSSRGNINLNIHLMQIPQHLRYYVMIHELCHLRHQNHGEEFHALLESLCCDFFGNDVSAIAGESGPEKIPSCGTGRSSARPVSRALEKSLKQYRLP